MPYFVLWSGAMYPREKTRRLEGGDWGGLRPGAFLDGKKLVNSPAVPVRIDLVPDDSGDMPPLFVVPALVVRKDLAEALKESGVENIDYYPAVLRNTKSGWVSDDYLIGNVLGIMDVIDMERSEIDPDSPPGVAMLFETMVIDESRCRGQKFFRLMQRPSRILVSQEVRDHVVSKKFKFVHFVPPEDFA